ncbi:MAG TPA: winged helix-turn-helix domain-containing protein [Thermoanaerobaculia bacterium]|nr:winged helix-turn-helix domain-containing protein [Thermoanaerobaculia bacterium]
MTTYEIEGWQVRPERNLLTRGAERVPLEPRVMDLLVHFAARPGEVLSRDHLIRTVWPDTFVSDAALHTAISSLRRAFGDDPRRPRVLETIPRRGYRLIARVERPRSIAVLPLRNRGGDPEEDFFAEGMTDGLIAELGRRRDLLVIAQRSAAAGRQAGLPPSEPARRLGAELLLEGSVQRQGDRIHLSLRLLEGAPGRLLWTRSWERSLREALALQRQVASAVIRELAIPDSGGTESRPERSVAPEAWVHFLRGRFHWYKLSPAHFPLALEHFREAIRIEPGFGDAHAGIADVWGAQAYWGLRPPAEVRDRVAATIATALEADPHSPDAWALQGSYQHYFARDREGAERSFRRALELNPSAVHAHLVLALLLSSSRRDEEALEAAAQCVRLDPLNPAASAALGSCLMAAGRPSEAVAALYEALDMDPSHRLANQVLADRLWVEGRDEAAIVHERAWWQVDPEIATILERAPRRELRKALREAGGRLAERARSRWVQPSEAARLYAHGGDPERALSWLEDALSAGDLRLIDGLRGDAWTTLRGEGRFERVERALVS